MILSKLIIYPYKIGSEGAAALATRLSALTNKFVRRFKPTSKKRLKPLHIVLNWGTHEKPWWGANSQWINQPSNVTIAANKRECFVRLKAAGVAIPEFTTSRVTAMLWVSNGDLVVCRKSLTGKGGSGIVLAGPGFTTEVVIAPLYTKYIPKKKEFRVHVAFGTVIHVAQKVRPGGEDGPNTYIRNSDNGWVFASQNLVEPADLRPLALQAVHACGLDFGACDIVWNHLENRCYVLEINTAPGIEGVTIDAYANAVLNKVY